jgi:hypothetical protein
MEKAQQKLSGIEKKLTGSARENKKAKEIM